MSDARALYRAAFQHFVNDRVDAAIEGYHAALAADPKLAIAWNGLSMAYRKQGALERATEAAQADRARARRSAQPHQSLDSLSAARDDPGSRGREGARCS
jgi:tetratricopeptide (TPR) repeat protein